MKKTVSFLLALCVTYISSDSAFAKVGDILNIQLGGSPSATYTNGAAINDNTQIWNRLRATVPTTVNNLKYYNSAPTDVTGISVTYHSNMGSATTKFPSTSLDVNLMKGFAKTTDTTGYFNFSGIANGTYDIYVYSQTAINTPSTLRLTVTTKIDRQEFSLTNSGNDTTLIENKNWMKKTIVVTDGTLNFTLGNNTFLNGIQIQQISTAVPEPASVVLIGIGGIFFFSYMKQQKKTEEAVDS